MSKIKIGNIRKKAKIEIINRGYNYYLKDHVFDFWERDKTINERNFSCYVASSNFDEYLVNLSLDFNNNFIEGGCSCPGNKRSNTCKHMIAGYLYYLNKVAKDEEVVAEKSKLENFIDLINSKSGKGRGIIKLDPVVTIGEEIGLSFRIGKEKLYVVRNIKNLLVDLRDRDEIYFGKEFTFVRKENKFSKYGERIIELLYSRLQDEIDGIYAQSAFSGKIFSFDNNTYPDIVEMLSKRTFNIEANGEIKKGKLLLEDPKLDFRCNLVDEKINVVLKEKPIKVAGNSLYYMDGNLYKSSYDFSYKYNSFEKLLVNNVLELEKNENPLFFKNVYGILKAMGDTGFDGKLEENIIEDDLNVQFYFDRRGNGVGATIFFNYGKFKINPLREDYEELIIRDVKKEEIVLDAMYDLGFNVKENVFELDAPEDIINLQLKGIKTLNELGDIYYSETFKTLKVHMKPPILTGLSMDGENWLTYNFNLEGYSNEDLLNAIKHAKSGRKFYRAKDGSFLYLQDEKFLELAKVFTEMDFKDDTILDGRANIGKYNALFMQGMVDECSEEVKMISKDLEEFKAKEINVPDSLNCDLREYQKEGLKWLCTIKALGFGGILADEMGLGKTVQTIAFILKCLEENKDSKHIIICPTSLIYNWADEISKFAPSLDVIVLYGNKDKRDEIINNVGDHSVIITSYAVARRDIDSLDKIDFENVIIDEAQAIKNPFSQNAIAVKKLVSNTRIALTGTPIENSLMELWSIFDFIIPGFLYDAKKFKSIYENVDLKEEKDALDRLRSKIGPFILRRKKNNVLTELPEKIERKMLVDLTKDQKLLYSSYINNLNSELQEEIKKNGINRSKIYVLSALTRLRQICSNPRSFIDDYDGGSGKVDAFIELVSNAILEGHKILVFSQFTSVLKELFKPLEDLNIGYMYLDGSNKSSERLKMVQKFNETDVPLFLISLKAGGTGLNLTSADLVIHFDPWWNPAVEEQASDRAHRIGQKNGVEVIKLITKGTIEEKIYNLQQDKKMLSSSLIDGGTLGSSIISGMTEDDIKELFMEL